MAFSSFSGNKMVFNRQHKMVKNDYVIVELVKRNFFPHKLSIFLQVSNDPLRGIGILCSDSSAGRIVSFCVI